MPAASKRTPAGERVVETAQVLHQGRKETAPCFLGLHKNEGTQCVLLSKTSLLYWSIQEK